MHFLLSEDTSELIERLFELLDVDDTAFSSVEILERTVERLSLIFFRERLLADFLVEDDLEVTDSLSRNVVHGRSDAPGIEEDINEILFTFLR